MTSTTVNPTLHPARSGVQTVRMLVVGLAVVLLLALSFAIGHVTGSSHQGPATTPALIGAQTNTGSGSGLLCQVGHLRGPC